MRVFYPPRRSGLIFQSVAILSLVSAGLWSLWQASRAQVGPVFFLYLLLALLVLALVPVLAYRAFAMWRGAYTLERDGLHLKWGLRAEDIPMDAVQWVRQSADLQAPLPLPVFRWPGSVLGFRRLSDGGQVEFLAAQSRPLILVATAERIFAISPHDPAEYLQVYQQFAEMGSLSPLPARSVYPAFLLARVWATPPARYLLLAGLALSLFLFAWVSLVIPERATIPLGFNPDGTPGEQAPSVRLLLLPVINSFFFLADVLAGLFFFRGDGSPEASIRLPLAYLLWGSGVLTALIFLGAVYFILSAG